MKRYIVAITGASGSIFGIKLLEFLSKKAELHVLISQQSFPIIKHETGIDWNAHTETAVQQKLWNHFRSKGIFFYHETNLFAPPSSGSFQHDGMFVVPCSMKSLSGIAHGYAENLIERAADATIKEGRHLLLSPREMPFSAIHLENMLKLAKLGVKIVPPVPAFYHRPKDLDDIIDFVTGKILDSFNIKHNLFKRWG